ncbi:MAG: ferredoxin oxidoreductase [Nitrososphaerota archaeon]|jgi:pyruvate ferredoxin oxidoreductase alpha subunit|nr:ferredoxin oxidoreductase [Nitrososphaerota archaeon]MDG6927075.1 ferredoxin oxidoreductase [Nitrososphaerota archaeon]MDG6929874.1 ferredoxin oxidoreductase [Nitrososphaerota archaeon]MDG6932358.1 ferredoxin oxidoreductase [Nitrososphaerota archaeon]MDG6935917.1 ferredoxin oxidoreductase [Nitrososphaerota archaeon]
METIAKSIWKRLPLSSNYAVAYAARDSDVDEIAAYPITPQTTVVEKLSEFIANGELLAEMVHVESEHSAMSASIGASAAGARAFTATSSQGLELMHELLHIASGMRLPIVMSVAARALSAPLSIWGDYSDVMNTRDTSWITIIASSAQEVYDSIVQAYRIAESVMLPVMVAYDGFMMSHTYEPVFVSEKAGLFRDYIPRKGRVVLDTKKPVTMGAVANPDWYYETKYQQVKAMSDAYGLSVEADQTFSKLYGRGYGLVEEYNVDNSELVILTYGGIFGTVKQAVDEMREQGIPVGAARVRLFRPFPLNELRSLLLKSKAVAVLDRSFSNGLPVSGPLAVELKSMMNSYNINVPVYSYIVGLGQRTVTEADISKIASQALSSKVSNESIYWGVRE